MLCDLQSLLYITSMPMFLGDTRKNKMNLYQCENYAKTNGFDSVEFIALFPAGPKKCRWLDAYFGMFQIDGVGDGFVMTRDIDKMFPDLECEIIQSTKK